MTPALARQEMIDSIVIRNFRSFNEVGESGFRRMNVLVGDNGSGKTAFLEALFLAAGVSPEIAIRTRGWRGGFEQSGGKVIGSQDEFNQALWADLFHKFQTKKPAYIALSGLKEKNRSVTVQFHERGKTRVEPPPRGKPGPPRVIPQGAPFDFKWKIQGYPDVSVAPTLGKEGLVFPPVRDAYIKAAFFAANQTPSALETASRFSRLSCAFREREFIESFQKLYHSIDNISVELAVGLPMIYAQVVDVPSKLPMSLASGGMNKLVAILLAMTDQIGGVILIDEIENGFYYKRLPLVWDALLRFATQYNCQIFASTHSFECLSAAAALAKNNPNEFAVLRTVMEDGETKLRCFDGFNFAEAVEENIEIR